MKCYTTNNEPEELELTQIRERLVKMIEQVGGEQSAKEFRYFEILVCSRACVVGYEGAMRNLTVCFGSTACRTDQTVCYHGR